MEGFCAVCSAHGGSGSSIKRSEAVTLLLHPDFKRSGHSYTVSPWLTSLRYSMVCECLHRYATLLQGYNFSTYFVEGQNQLK